MYLYYINQSISISYGNLSCKLLYSLVSLFTVDLSEVGDHDLHQASEVNVVLPAPLLPGQLVVKDHGPAVSNLLSAVRAVGDLQLRHPLLYLQSRGYSLRKGRWNYYLFKYFLWSETHSVQVECSGGELVSRGHHVLDCPPQTVVNVHHGQPGVGSQVALVLLRGQSVVEDLDSIVRGSSAGMRVVGNNSWEPGGPTLLETQLLILPQTSNI